MIVPTARPSGSRSISMPQFANLNLCTFRHGPRIYVASAFSLLACMASVPSFAETASAIDNAARNLALYQETLDLCLKSGAYRTLPLDVVLEFDAMSKTINHLENDMHEAPKGKLMYISYQINARAYRKSVEFRNHILGQEGGVCDYRKTRDIALKLKPLEAVIRRHIGVK
jgi:hypothetical protein